MAREYIVENEDLIKKEKKLKCNNRISNVILVILVMIAITVGYLGYTGKIDSWFFKDVVGIETETTVSSE